MQKNKLIIIFIKFLIKLLYLYQKINNYCITKDIYNIYFYNNYEKNNYYLIYKKTMKFNLLKLINIIRNN